MPGLWKALSHPGPLGSLEVKTFSQQHLPVFSSVAVCYHLLLLLKYPRAPSVFKEILAHDFPRGVLLTQRTACSPQTLVVCATESSSAEGSL